MTKAAFYSVGGSHAAPLTPAKSKIALASLLIVIGGASCAIAADGVQPKPDATRGKSIAERWCVSCHVVSQSTTTVPEGIPTFRSIANRRQQTADHIRQTLISPHVPMPDMHLTEAEIQDLIAYFDELRDPAAAPLLRRRSQDASPSG